jgi:hypothetical protein
MARSRISHYALVCCISLQCPAGAINRAVASDTGASKELDSQLARFTVTNENGRVTALFSPEDSAPTDLRGRQCPGRNRDDGTMAALLGR